MTKDESTRSEEGEAVVEDAEALEERLGRPEENPVLEWVLLTGSRMAVTGTILVGVAVVLLVAPYIPPIDVHTMLTETNTVDALFSSLLSGAILLVSIVVSINFVVLSQEITDIEDQEERVSASLEYRRQVEQYIEDDVIPARPADFIRVVLYTILRQTWEMEEWSVEDHGEEFQELLDTYVGAVQEEILDAREPLGDATYGTFEVLLVGLDYDYSGQLHAARRFNRQYAHVLTEEEEAGLDSLVEMLKFYATGREYFKSLYYKKELAHLSSRLLYITLPVVVFTSFVLLAFDTDMFPRTVGLTLSPLLVFVVVAYVVAVAPYVVLTAYVIRLMIVTLRTLSAGPFIMEETGELEGLDWGTAEQSIDWTRPDDDPEE